MKTAAPTGHFVSQTGYGLAFCIVGVACVLPCGCRSQITPARNTHFAKIPTVISEFIFAQAPFAECHASTLVQLPTGDILAAWFGGAHEGDRSVAIWGAKYHQGRWSSPVELAREPGVPCWNPVLFCPATAKSSSADPVGNGEPASEDTIWLFYKVGTSPKTWAGAYRTSADGDIWSPVSRLPTGILGPIKNKPIVLTNGDIVAGSSVETVLSWTCWVDISSDGSKTWKKYGPIRLTGFHHGIIQPTLWETAPGHLKMLTRATLDMGFICEASSSDGGRTWTQARPTTLPNPNSGIDAVQMQDGTVALVYNHSKTERSPLTITFSHDDGATWSAPLTIDDGAGEYSYPSIIQTHDGLLHITYTWHRKQIRHVVIDPSNHRM